MNKIHCANCLHAKVTKSTALKRKERVLCKKGHWVGPNGVVRSQSFASIRNVRADGAQVSASLRTMHGMIDGRCPNYESMGDDLEEFLESLPLDDVDYTMIQELQNKNRGRDPGLYDA